MEPSHLSTKSRSRGSAPPLAQQSSRDLATVSASSCDDGSTGLRWNLPSRLTFSREASGGRLGSALQVRALRSCSCSSVILEGHIAPLSHPTARR